MPKAIQPASSNPRRWKKWVAAFSLAALLGTPIMAVAAESAPTNGTQATDAAAIEKAQDAADKAAQEIAERAAGADARASGDVVSFILGEGTYDFAKAQQVVDGLNARRGSAGALGLDAGLQEAAMQRAAEYSLWLSGTRPNGEDIAALITTPGSSDSQEEESLLAQGDDEQVSDGTSDQDGTGQEDGTGQGDQTTDEGGEGTGDESEDQQPLLPTTVVVALAHGDSLEPSAVVESVAQSHGQDLGNAGYTSVGVGCWYQGGHRFYAVILSPTAASGQARTSGVEVAKPEVAVDMSGATSKVLQSRLKVDGYETTVNLPKGASRAVTFSWVTAPEEKDLATATNMPSIKLDSSSFDWESSDPSVASVSDAGVIHMLASSAATPTGGASSTVTATLKDSSRALTMQVMGSVPLYRLYNPYTYEHFYTADRNEYDSLGANGWTQEGLEWEAPWSPATLVTATPVYRLYNQYSDDHHYTANRAEYDALGAQGWTQEGVRFYSEDESGTDVMPIYRLFNPYEQAATHFYTNNLNEYNENAGLGWRQEGKAFFGLTPEQS